MARCDADCALPPPPKEYRCIGGPMVGSKQHGAVVQLGMEAPNGTGGRDGGSGEAQVGAASSPAVLPPSVRQSDISYILGKAGR